MHPRTTIASSAALIVVLAGGAAAATSSPGTSPAPSTSTSSAPDSATSTTSPSASSAASPGASVTPLVMKLDAKGQFERAALPAPHALFTKNELRSVLPGLSAVSGSDDTITLTLAGDDARAPSTLVVDLPHFGTKADITKTWNAEKELHRARADKNAGLYTFFGADAHGVSDSFTDGTTTHVLVTNGDAAGIIRFSGIGFGKLRDTHAASRAAYTSTVAPDLIELLGAKVKAGAGAKPQPTAAPSASGTSSGSATSRAQSTSPSASSGS